MVSEKISENEFYTVLNNEMKKTFEEEINAFGKAAAKKLLAKEIADRSFDENIKKGRYCLKDAINLGSAFGIDAERLYDSINQIVYRKVGKKSKSAKPMKLPQNFENFFYLVGLLFGDGSGDKLVVGKKELGTKFVEICHELGIQPYFRNYKGKCPEIGTGCKTLVEILKSIFEYPLEKKSHNIHATEFLFTAPKECVSAFIRGYMDCDGTVEKSRGAISISSASQQMLKDLQMLLLRFECIANLQDNTIYISGEAASNFVGEIGFYLQYKMEKALKLAEGKTGSAVLDLIPVSEEADEPNFTPLLQIRVTANNANNYHFQKYAPPNAKAKN